MFKVIVIATFGLMLTGCTVSMPNISGITEREGPLIVVCPDGKVVLNTTRQKNCFDFMEAGDGS